MRLNIQFILVFILSGFILLSHASTRQAHDELTLKQAPQQNKLVRQNQHSHTAIRNDEQIIAFVSFSMPEPALKSWLLDAQKVGVLVVTRGLVNNSFKETLQAFSKLTDDSMPVGIQIDPELFRTYAIEQVPALVVTQNGASKSFDVIRGNTTMRYALQTLSEKGEMQSAQLKQALTSLGELYE